MARCLLCQVETKVPEGEARLREGWLFTEARGKYNNKYGVFCPNHPADEVAKTVGLLLERAMLPDGARSAEAEKMAPWKPGAPGIRLASSGQKGAES